MESGKSLRETSHYNVFRIGADTDLCNGRIKVVEDLLKKLEGKGDYVACQAIFDSLEVFFGAKVRNA